jgi:hypothetical protein
MDEVDDHQGLAGHHLRSLWPPGVIQELYALLIPQYAIRVAMHEAALLAAVDPERLRFTHALQFIQEAISEFQMTAPELLPKLHRRMLLDIAACAPTHALSSARCPSSVSSVQNTVIGLSPLAHSERLWPIFERY